MVLGHGLSALALLLERVLELAHTHRRGGAALVRGLQIRELLRDGGMLLGHGLSAFALLPHRILEFAHLRRCSDAVFARGL